MSWFSKLFGRGAAPASRPVQIFFANTLSGNKEVFVPLRAGVALMYSCGPTVYGPAHVGNLRSYVFSDTIARTLTFAGYRVKRVINITDFGHLVSDGDQGEDKMTKGLKREGLELTLENMRVLAERYTANFIDDLEALNIDTNDITFPRASDYIAEQIALIQTLEQKGFAYATRDGVYFDTARFPHYGKLGSVDLDAQQEGTRVKQTKEKRNPADFVLWKPDRKLGWQSPWGLGFPGWHIECSAMSRALLGTELDIHTGGEDHIKVHHNNEIAQSEAASGRVFVRYWMHNAFLTMDGEKAAKSLGNVVYLNELPPRGIHPLALRYFFLQAHYRSPLSFTWESLTGASAALTRLWKLVREVGEEAKHVTAPSEARTAFLAAMRDDLSTPQALATLWDALKSEEYSPEEKWGLVEDAEAHLGLSLTDPPETGPQVVVEVPEELSTLLVDRQKAREAKDFAKADQIRLEIQNRGYHVEDGPDGPVLTNQS